jgi:hypothetical protein
MTDAILVLVLSFAAIVGGWRLGVWIGKHWPWGRWPL